MPGFDLPRGRNRHQLVSELSDRLLAWEASGDPNGLLGVEVPRLALELAELLPSVSPGAAASDVIEALSVLVALHWARYQILDDGRDQDDLNACLKSSSTLLPVAASLVPEPRE
jgi:hypothetical protein